MAQETMEGPILNLEIKQASYWWPWKRQIIKLLSM